LFGRRCAAPGYLQLDDQAAELLGSIFLVVGKVVIIIIALILSVRLKFFVVIGVAHVIVIAIVFVAVPFIHTGCPIPV
jgi:hypothetical protein